MNPSSRTHPQDSHVGPKSTGGKAAQTSTPANAHLGQDKPGIFDKEGAVGKQFQPEGAIGSVGEKVGGPLSSQGIIGKQFTDQGSIGGTIQSTLGGKSKTSN